MNNFSQILAELRERDGLSQQKMAEKIGIPARTWANYESGRTNPTVDVLQKMAEKGYKIQGFNTGIVEDMIADGVITQERFEKLIALSKELPPDTEIDEISQMLKNQSEIKTKLGENEFKIPILEQKLSAGHGQELPDDDKPTGYIAAPKELRRYGNKLAALYVAGDSMEPTLHRGDLIVCDCCGWDGEGIYALRMNGEGFVKRLSQRPGKILVISDNPKYEPWEESAESTSLEIIGRVHYTLKRTE